MPGNHRVFLVSQSTPSTGPDPRIESVSPVHGGCGRRDPYGRDLQQDHERALVTMLADPGIYKTPEEFVPQLLSAAARTATVRDEPTISSRLCRLKIETFHALQKKIT